jgi:hypothetical protein
MNRRAVIVGGLAGAVAAGLGAWKLRLFRKHYAPTPYDDLLNQIVDREPAAKLGAVLGGRSDAASLAARLRARPRLTVAARADIGAGRLVEADGWQLPESLALYAMLAAKFS